MIMTKEDVLSNKNEKVIVLGGGVSGLIFACFEKKEHPNNEVIVIEKSDKTLQRILISGNGRCNFYNKLLIDNNFEDSFFNPLKSIVKNDVGNKAFEEFVSFFDIPYYETNNLFYPFGNKSEIVKRAIDIKAEKLGVKIVKSKFEGFIKEGNRIGVVLDKYKHFVDRYVIALGGQSLNYEPFDFSLFNILNLKIHSFESCLAPVYVKENVKELDGVRIKCGLSLLKDNKVIYKEDGEVLFKKDGLSGICVFNATARINQKEFDKYKISLNLTSHDNSNLWRVTRSNLYNCFPYKLAQYLDKRFRDDEINNNVRNLMFSLKGIYPFCNSEVSKGGIDLTEINTNNMTLNKFPNIGVLGEIIDLTLPCGGFNIGMCIIESYLLSHR